MVASTSVSFTLLTIIVHIPSYAGSLILSAIYGYQVDSEDDRFLTLVAKVLSIITDGIFSGSGIWLVDVFPFCKLYTHRKVEPCQFTNTSSAVKHVPTWFPGAEFKRKAVVWRGELQKLVNEPYDYVKAKMVGSQHHPMAPRLMRLLNSVRVRHLLHFAPPYLGMTSRSIPRKKLTSSPLLQLCSQVVLLRPSNIFNITDSHWNAAASTETVSPTHDFSLAQFKRPTDHWAY